MGLMMILVVRLFFWIIPSEDSIIFSEIFFTMIPGSRSALRARSDVHGGILTTSTTKDASGVRKTFLLNVGG